MSRARRTEAGRRPAVVGRALSSCLVGIVVVLPVITTMGGGGLAVADPQPSASASATPRAPALTVTAAPAGRGTISVSGTLVGGDGRPLGHKVISVTVDDAMMGGATTGSDGQWSTRITLPQTFPQGAHQVVALFLDAGFDGPVSATTTLVVGNLPDTKLTATAAAATVGRHQLLTVSGRLTTSTGAPLPDCAIVVGTPDGSGAVTTGVTESNGTFVVDYRIHETAGDDQIPVHFDGSDSGKASSASLSVTVTDKPVPSATPTPSPAASEPVLDSGPGDLQPTAPTTPLPAKQRAELTSGPLTSSTNLAVGGVGLLALLTSLAMLGRSLAPAKPGDERIRLIDR